MVESQCAGVQERARQRDLLPRSTVGAVADHRMTYSREVHSDLMRAPRLERALEQAALRRLERYDDPVLGSGRLARVAYRHARAPRRGTADRRVDQTAR